MKRLLVITLVALFSVGLFGCTAASNSPSTTDETDSSTNKNTNSESDDGEGPTLTYWYWADNSDYSDLMQNIITEFNETNDKGITVVGEEYPWDGGGFMETLFTASVGGGAPDVATFKLTSTPLFTANDLLANLDDYIENWDKKDDIDPNIYDIMKTASGTDSIYLMPWNTQVLYVYYRPSIFEEAGVEVPTTYEEFLTAIEKTTMDTDGDGQTDIYGFGMRGATGGQEPWGSFIHARGGSFDDLTSEASIRGMQDFIDIYENGYVPKTATTDGFNEIIANFKSGHTAMTIHHTGSSADMVETFGDDVSAFPFPAGEGQWTSMGDTENVIFESSEHKDAAFEWVSYLAAEKGQEDWTVATGNVPVSKTVQELDFFQENEFMKASIDGMSYAGIVPIKDTTTEWINTIWPNTIASALLGERSADEAMEILHEGLHEE
ncbi:multiple sugar transport system substrate-binding protein [Gracilibacillus halotolerans]|uniref:Multiple sugar transport system substrate-binding protein n=1 Tax=Gracilibacillus halotolerans TaxID=74386 RepID=A0A841RQA4_9BACI|nr:sugar ABC transporter substrate-binding protein [Gracilibacillus halotolerans]MBB6512828.1 multiple sugar transport system substrate-binding protein [Gracilibacillus halotolerans]